MAKSMGYNMAAGMQNMLKDGHKSMQGVDDAVLRNIEAAKGLATIVASSLGPNGMKKLVINHLEKIIVTSDCATIVKELEIQHPAARMLVLACEMQEKECGDGTNFVVTFAGELLKLSEDLLRTGLHTSEIVEGYKRAFDKAVTIMDEQVVYELKNPRDLQELTYCLKSVVGTKYHGFEDLIAPAVAEACIAVMPRKAKNPSVNVDSVRICKLLGGTISDSKVVQGMVVQRDTEGTIKRVEKAKVAVFGCGLESASTETKGTVLIRNAEDLMNYNKSEEKSMEDTMKAIADSGVTCIIANGTVSEMALHFCERFNIMVIKIMSKWELRRLCGAVNASASVRLGPLTPEEYGYCDLIEVNAISGRKVTILKQEDESNRISTIVLRASTANVLDDLARAVDDGINCVKSLCANPKMVAGGSATEIELARQITAFAKQCPGLDQYAIEKFGESLEIFSRILAENGGMEASDVIAALYAEHAKGNNTVGIDAQGSEQMVSDKAKVGVLDSLAVKQSAMRLAVDAVLTVLRVDQIIMAKTAGGPKPPKQGRPDN